MYLLVSKANNQRVLIKGGDLLTVGNTIFGNKGRSPYNGRLSDFSFYIDSQISVHRKFKK